MNPIWQQQTWCHVDYTVIEKAKILEVTAAMELFINRLGISSLVSVYMMLSVVLEMSDFWNILFTCSKVATGLGHESALAYIWLWNKSEQQKMFYVSVGQT